MKYTISDIRIKDPLPKYEGNGLSISYTIEDNSAALLLELSNTSLVDAILSSGLVVGVDFGDYTVRTSFNHSWISLSLFMEHYLNLSLVEHLVLHHLNNKTEKP